MLHLLDVYAGYASGTPVLKGVSIDVATSEVVAIVGPNGAGKSTVLRTASGLTNLESGTITLNGSDVTQLSTEDRTKLGLVLVLQGRSAVPFLSVEENLRLGGFARRREHIDLGERLDSVFELFPQLSDRRKQIAGTLSGGQQQMVELGRALIAKPRVLMLDEPSLGLAPKLTEELLRVIRSLADTGIAILVVEQRVNEVFTIADRVQVLRLGKGVYEGDVATLQEGSTLQELFLGT